MDSLEFINTNIYQKPKIYCPLCKSQDIRLLYTIERYKPSFKVDRCKTCGFIFMNPPFQRHVVESFYTEAYYDGSAEYSYHDERDTKKHPAAVREKRISLIHNKIGHGNFLDIGAAFGSILESASKYYSAYGIEISQYAGSIAKKTFGKKIHIGTLEDHPFPGGFFSVITMIEVLEHLENPYESLHECHRLLQNGGLLVIQTANMGGLQAKIQKHRYAYFMPGHVSYFAKHNLIETLRKIGFKRIVAYHPIEFGLIPKLIKSRGTFNSLWDYRKWVRITLYHFISKIHFGGFSMTSSMSVYAYK